MFNSYLYLPLAPTILQNWIISTHIMFAWDVQVVRSHAIYLQDGTHGLHAGPHHTENIYSFSSCKNALVFVFSLEVMIFKTELSIMLCADPIWAQQGVSFKYPNLQKKTLIRMQEPPLFFDRSVCFAQHWNRWFREAVMLQLSSKHHWILMWGSIFNGARSDLC